MTPDSNPPQQCKCGYTFSFLPDTELLIDSCFDVHFMQHLRWLDTQSHQPESTHDCECRYHDGLITDYDPHCPHHKSAPQGDWENTAMNIVYQIGDLLFDQLTDPTDKVLFTQARQYTNDCAIAFVQGFLRQVEADAYMKGVEFGRSLQDATQFKISDLTNSPSKA